MALKVRNSDSKGKGDGITFFYGVQIEDKWYFFSGPYMVLPREKGKSLTFTQLHDIAMKKVFQGYLKKSSSDEWEINEEFFSDIDRILAIHKGKFETEEEWERWWTKSVIESNWNKRNTSSKKLY
ncbi:MAG: hypothetical protein KF870_05720 [Leadbetterella sp.]|nr:hypothetical protein [Leadbetterella sp.]